LCCSPNVARLAMTPPHRLGVAILYDATTSATPASPPYAWRLRRRRQALSRILPCVAEHADLVLLAVPSVRRRLRADACVASRTAVLPTRTPTQLARRLPYAAMGHADAPRTAGQGTRRTRCTVRCAYGT